MKVKVKCADKEAREIISKICDDKKDKTEFEVLLCEIISFADNCESD